MSTRKVDDPVKALDADTGISKSEVSRICKDLGKEFGSLARAKISPRLVFRTRQAATPQSGLSSQP